MSKNMHSTEKANALSMFLQGKSHSDYFISLIAIIFLTFLILCALNDA